MWTVVPDISVDPCLRNSCRWVVVSEISSGWVVVPVISAGELLSQKFLRVSRCQRNFCGSWKQYFLSYVFANVLQTSETTVINAYRQQTANLYNRINYSWCDKHKSAFNSNGTSQPPFRGYFLRVTPVTLIVLAQPIRCQLSHEQLMPIFSRLAQQNSNSYSSLRGTSCND